MKRKLRKGRKTIRGRKARKAIKTVKAVKAVKTIKTVKAVKTIRRLKGGDYDNYTSTTYQGMPISTTAVFVTPTGTQSYMNYIEEDGDPDID